MRISKRRVMLVRKGKMPVEYYDFHTGLSCRAYSFMGCHKRDQKYEFRVWAPNADKVFLVGDFNGWSESHPMTRATLQGIFEIGVDASEISIGSKYKYKIINGSRTVYKSDPYGVKMESPPNGATIIVEDNDFTWHDRGWLSHRRAACAAGMQNQPMNIYEVHLGSWKKHPDGSFYSYAEIAGELAPYMKQMGYTHIQLMPVSEHPFDASLGYQISGYYAPTSRFGEPDGLKEFVDIMHTAGVGVILDWVPAYFPKDEYGLFEFDGQPLYEYQSYDRQESRSLGMRKFDVGREEVVSFLVSNAIYYVDKYHVDGIRVNAVSQMLCLDYEKEYGRWIPNVLGDNRNLEAIAFFKRLNSVMKKEYPTVLMIAEEYTSWQGLTSFEGENGLGFDMKWNTAWCTDTLSYIEKDPIFRKYHHERLSYSLCYSTDDKYILPMSHVEFSHGKPTLIGKQVGDYWNKFAGARALMGYMMTHPGKKLTFMGCETAQFSEWSYRDSLDWSVLDYDMHARFQLYLADINNFYLAHPELWQCDCDKSGFEWIDANDKERSIIAFDRIDSYGKRLHVIINFTPIPVEDYHLYLDEEGIYEELLNSDDKKYGGSGVVNTGVRFNALPSDISEHPYCVRLRLPPMAICVFKCTRKSNKKSVRPN